MDPILILTFRVDSLFDIIIDTMDRCTTGGEAYEL